MSNFLPFIVRSTSEELLKEGGSVNGTIDPDPWGAWFPHDDAGNATKSPAKVITSAAGGSQSPWTTLGIGNQAVPGFAWWKRGARWNDTTTGTWTTIDPITKLNDPNRANPYTYVGDDPINSIDPAGKDWWNPFSWDWTSGGLGCFADSVGLIASTGGIVFGGPFGIATGTVGFIASAQAGATDCAPYDGAV